MVAPRHDSRDLFPSTHWDNTPDPHFASRHRIRQEDGTPLIWWDDVEGYDMPVRGRGGISERVRFTLLVGF